MAAFKKGRTDGHRREYRDQQWLWRESCEPDSEVGISVTVIS